MSFRMPPTVAGNPYAVRHLASPQQTPLDLGILDGPKDIGAAEKLAHGAHQGMIIP
jgi:hypothetical protein